MKTTARTALAAATAVAAALVAHPAARAEERLLELDPAATLVHFTVGATGHDVHGSFHVASGSVRFDAATGAASGEIRVDALSAETGNGSRDDTLKEDVLETAKFPLFVFTPEKLVGALPESGEGAVELHGTVQMHGASHALALPAKVKREGDRITLAADFQVPYVEWGMHNPSFLFLRVDDVVQVHLDGQGSLAPAAAATVARNGR